ncbi:MAG: 3-deoxy-7-phosphoheptulonate synthase [Thermotogota bacterium]
MEGLNLCTKQSERQKTVVKVGTVEIGKEIVIIAGPCSVETEDQMIETSKQVKEAGANILRGGVFKPRTSPYSFQGLGVEGLMILKKASLETGLPVITEVIDPRDVYVVSQYADILQIGARNIQNFPLLKEVGRSKKPVLLKRGNQTTLFEFLNSAEYILSEGNSNVILCERGIRTFETYTRNTLDLSIIPSVKKESHLPIFVDPSHGTGMISHIESMSLAALAAGADGLMIEVHNNPQKALSDGDQSLNITQFKGLMEKIKSLREDFILKLKKGA